MRLNFGKQVACLVMVVLMLTLFGVTVLAQTAPTDVPTSHWAYKAVKLLVDKGYLQLYQDQTFKGDQPVDRYTLAMVVAKILNEVALGSTATNREDVKLMRSLSVEFRNELVDVIMKNNNFTKKLDELNRQDAVLKEDVTNTNLVVQTLTAEQQELQKEVQQIIADLVLLKQKVEALESQNAALKADVERLRAENEANKKYIWIGIILGIIGIAV